MYRVLRFYVVIAVIISSAGISFAEDTRLELDSLVEKWTESLLNENIDDFLDCYWDDAVRIKYFPGSDAEITEGMIELRTSESASFEKLDFRTMNLIYDEPVRFFPKDGRPTYIYPNSRFSYMDVFEFEKRQGRYRIIKQYLMPHPASD